MEFIEKDGKIFVEEQCKSCGSVYATVSEGKGKHAARLDCMYCGKFNKWMSKAHLDIFECVTSETPAEDYIVKLQAAQARVRDSLKSDDWIERKVADKNCQILLDYKDKIAGICHYD